MKLSDLTKEERSLLLYFESCAVDYAGKVDARRMNKDDIEIAQRWSNDRFLLFGRMAFDHINFESSPHMAYYCLLSPEAWDLAHQERRARAERMRKNSEYDVNFMGKQYPYKELS